MTAQLGKRRPRLRWPFLVALVAMLLFAVIATLTGFLVSIGAPTVYSADLGAHDFVRTLARSVALPAPASGSFTGLTFAQLRSLEAQTNFGFVKLTTGDATPFVVSGTSGLAARGVSTSVAICADGPSCREVVFAARGHQQRCWYARDLVTSGSRPPRVKVLYALVKSSRYCSARSAPRTGWSRVDPHVPIIG